MSTKAEEQAAWIDYRDRMARERPWCTPAQVARQLGKRDFIAGYRAAKEADQ